MSIVTCHTDGCGNADAPIEVDLTVTLDDGTELSVGSVTCGACGQPITDIQDDSSPDDAASTAAAADEGSTAT